MTPPASMPLPLATPGEALCITAFAHGRDLEKRLASMGLTLGCTLCLMQQEDGDLVVAVGNTRLALGHGLAQKILVSPVEDKKGHKT